MQSKGFDGVYFNGPYRIATYPLRNATVVGSNDLLHLADDFMRSRYGRDSLEYKSFGEGKACGVANCDCEAESGASMTTSGTVLVVVPVCTTHKDVCKASMVRLKPNIPYVYRNLRKKARASWDHQTSTFAVRATTGNVASKE